jgi:hypothetical protein
MFWGSATPLFSKMILQAAKQESTPGSWAAEVHVAVAGGQQEDVDASRDIK